MLLLISWITHLFLTTIYTIQGTELEVKSGFLFRKKILISEVQKIIEKQLNCLTYCEADGTTTHEYPLNPNGAAMACAGLTDETGQVFGLMPHPEAYLSLYNHPNWGQKKRQNPNVSENGEGLQIFKNIVTHISQKKEATTLV